MSFTRTIYAGALLYALDLAVWALGVFSPALHFAMTYPPAH